MSGSMDFGVASPIPHWAIHLSPTPHSSPFQVRPTGRSDYYRIGALGVLFLSFSNLRILCFYRYSRDLLCYLDLWLFIGFTTLELTFEK